MSLNHIKYPIASPWSQTSSITKPPNLIARSSSLKRIRFHSPPISCFLGPLILAAYVIFRHLARLFNLLQFVTLDLLKAYYPSTYLLTSLYSSLPSSSILRWFNYSLSIASLNIAKEHLYLWISSTFNLPQFPLIFQSSSNV